MSQDESPPNAHAETMPGSVRLAVVGLLLLVAALTSILVIVVRMGQFPITEPIGIAIALFILYGLVRGNRFAYRWGRNIGVLGAALNFIVALWHFTANANFLLGAICAVAALAQISVFVSLSSYSAREYYGLICTKCSSDEAGANDFFFSQAKCGQCGAVWQ